MLRKLNQTERRVRRVRTDLKQTSGSRPRLSVHRSSQAHLRAGHRRRAQGSTVAAASSLEKDLKGKLKTGADKAAAAAVGKLLAERARQGRRQRRRVRSRRFQAFTAASRRWPTARAKAD